MLFRAEIGAVDHHGLSGHDFAHNVEQVVQFVYVYADEILFGNRFDHRFF